MVVQNLKVRVDAIINDGSATLLSRAYSDPATRFSVILGTGSNASIILPVSALASAKFGSRPKSWHDKAEHVLVNTEFSMFGKGILPLTRWDEYIDQAHIMPGFQPFEHLISGRYLGEIVRQILLEAIQNYGLFKGQIPERFLEPYALDTSTLAVIES
jgi:hexokinase